jgi:hypothetical protein
MCILLYKCPHTNMRQTTDHAADTITSAPTVVLSSTLQGDFGPCEFSMINILAFDPSNVDSSLDDGDAIMVYFTEPTDKDCDLNYLDASCRNGKYLNKTEVDNMLTFSNVVGVNYSATWINSMQINLLNVSMLTFSNVVGVNYSATWINSSRLICSCMQLQINLLNVSGSTAKIDQFTIIISDQTRGRYLRCTETHQTRNQHHLHI